VSRASRGDRGRSPRPAAIRDRKGSARDDVGGCARGAGDGAEARDAAPAAGAPSPFVAAWLDAAVAASALGPALDLACGRGRHALALAAAGAPTLALDRDEAALSALAAEARARRLPLACLRVDLEGRGALPLAPGRLGVLLVSRYLWRPLAPALAALLAPGGLLLYETFIRDREGLGHSPRNPAFLLEPGELLALFPGLRAVAYAEGRFASPRGPEALARLAARKS
jgi:SAM-dependent methyltransferase